jgi:hypothetical protein
LVIPISADGVLASLASGGLVDWGVESAAKSTDIRSVFAGIGLPFELID